MYEEERIPLVRQLLRDHPLCQACFVFAYHDGTTIYTHNRSTDIHERLPRGRGGSITDPGNCLAVCRPCHDRITWDPALAEALGLLAKTGPSGY